MRYQEHVPFRELTTFKVGGTARHVFLCENTVHISSALAFSKEHNLPSIVLGEGSNILPPDATYEGVVLRMTGTGITADTDGDDVLVTAQAGEHWDSFIDYVTERGWWGVENLAGIPGSVGASPVQNIGAYGMDVSETIVSIEVYNANSGKEETYANEDVRFGYRDSIFKRDPSLIVCSVTFRLHSKGAPRTGYPDLRKAEACGIPLNTPREIRDATREIRAGKFPDLHMFGTAGSFFKNPIVTREVFERLSAQFGAIPSFPHGASIKIPLAFILDHILGLKGYKSGDVFLFGNQPLVLVAEKGATAQDIDVLAKEIEERVLNATGIAVEREVRTIFEHEYKK